MVGTLRAGISLSLEEAATEVDGAAAAGLIGRRTVWHVPGAADGASVLIDPVEPELSALLARMRSRSPSSQMPPLGTVLRDQVAVDALTEWIRGELATTAAARNR